MSFNGKYTTALTFEHLCQGTLSKLSVEMLKLNGFSFGVRKRTPQRGRARGESASTEETGAEGSGEVYRLQEVDMLQDQGHLREQFLSYLLERMKEAEAAVDYAVKKQEEHQRCLAVKVCEAQALAQQHREGAFETAQMAAQSLQQMRTVRQDAANAIVTRSAVADAEQAAQDAVLRASEADAQATAAAAAADTMVCAKKEHDARLQQLVEEAEARATMATQAWWEAGLRARRLGAFARASAQTADAIAANAKSECGELDFGARSRSPSSSTSTLATLCSPVTSELQHQSWSLRPVQPKSTEERGSGEGERSGFAEGREGAGGAGVPSPTSVEHPTAHASTGRGADARDGEASDKARVGRGRHRRNMVAGQVVDPERLVSLVLSMGGARSLTAKRRWRVSLSTPACISASHASDTPAFLASLPFVPSLSFPSPPRLRLPISTYSSCFWMLCL